MRLLEFDSPNKSAGRAGHVPDMVVFGISGASLSDLHPRYMDPLSAESPHYLITADGTVRQYINLTDRASVFRTSSVSGNADFYKKGRGLIAARPFDASLYTISVIFEGSVLTQAQKETAPALLGLIGKKMLRIYTRKLPCDENHIVTVSSLPVYRGSGDIPVDGFLEICKALPV